jgi:uncharacterized protein (TIGR01777 family)
VFLGKPVKAQEGNIAFLSFFSRMLGKETSMKVLISGSSGLIGSALRQSLLTDGHAVVSLPRTFEEPIDFSGVDVVVHLAGENIAGGRWTADKKRRIEESRVKGTRQLAEQMAGSAVKPSTFICASAIGFYGSRADEPLDEESPGGSGFLAAVCRKWEAAARPAEAASIRTVWIRTGVVLSTNGGALKKMLTPFKLGGGGIVGDGRQYISWISLDDEVQAIRFIMNTAAVRGAVNLVSPGAVTNQEFTKTLGKVLRRPTVLPLPAPAARIIFGEMADELLLGSTRVIPKKLVEAGYEFCHPDLQSALEDILQ